MTVGCSDFVFLFYKMPLLLVVAVVCCFALSKSQLEISFACKETRRWLCDQVVLSTPDKWYFG